jgi:hypothetical protein
MYCREETLPHGTRVWTFWCPHCRQNHWHAPEPGHCRANCGDWRSPFYERGYVLALVPRRAGKPRRRA